MASFSKADSRRMYSWWWNSHISPKNSKWLQENLTDVDIKVKAMIKLIEEDADSFARRAEMYYKKRPELIKLVEELYRAYRALAEKYDHATGALRQAHKTMSEAFPNQVPAGCDDSVPNSPYDSDPQTPDSRTSKFPCFDSDDLQKDGSTGTARKTLSFSESDGNNKHRSQDRNLSRFENAGVNDKEIALLKDALAKLEGEKEAAMKQYLESLDKLSKLESEILKSQEDSRELADRASKAEAESQEMKEMLRRLESEKEESFELYHRAQKKIEEINEQSLKEEIKSLRDERDAAYDQYKQSVNLQSDLKKKLLEAEKEIETLKLAIVSLTKEKEAQDILYQQCMETISSLELRLVCAEEETERLKAEIDNGVSLLKAAEEQRLLLEKSNKSLHMELESMGVRIGTQNQEITEKQKELGRLWTCIQEERVRFVEAETAFQTLQQLHAQSQEELRSMASELQNQAIVLRDVEARNQVLEGEIQKKIDENKNLNELNLSSAISLKEMQKEISNLKESNGKLEEEVDLRVDQRNALQQELYCLKEELNELNKKHGSVVEQVAYVGLNPESLGASVKELQNENTNLKEEWQNEKTAKAALLEKLEMMGQLLERNVVLENSLSDLGAELEGVRGKLKALDESYQSLSEEKSNLTVENSNLLGQLQVTTDNLSQVSEENTVLENALFDAHVKLEVLKQKSKTFEDSCQLLADEKSALITEKGTLVSQMEVAENNLKDLERKYTDLEEKYSLMEKERGSTLQKVEELNASLAIQNQEHVTFAQMNDIQLHAMRSRIQLLQEESLNKSKEFEQELDKSFGSEIAIFVLLKCAQDLEEKKISLFNDYQKLQEASKLSESLIHVLKQEKTENQLTIKSLSDQNNRLINGMHQLVKAAGLSLHPGCVNGKEQTCFNNIQQRIEGKNRALIENEDKNMELVVETTILVTLLRQFKTKLVDLEAEKRVIEQELGVRAEKILRLQNEFCKLSAANEELRSKVIEGDINELGLRTQLENIQCELSDVQEAFRTLQMENTVILEQKKSLLKDNVQNKNKICVLEGEKDVLFTEVLSQGIFSQTLKNHIDEKHEELYLVEKKFEEVVNENLDLRKTLEKSEREFRTIQSVRDMLNLDLVNGNNLLQSKEKELKNLENDKKELSEVVADLRGENDIIVSEVLSQGILSQALKNHIGEKHEELTFVEKKLKEVVNENLDLRKTLEESEHEIKTLQSVRDKLNLDLANGSCLLQSKEKESKMLENDKKELAEIVADLRRENDIIVNEVLSQGILSHTLKSHVDEKHEELSLVEKKLKEVVNENLDLRKTLEEFEHEIRTVQSVRDKLNLDLLNGNKLLQLKERESKMLENDNKELSETVADLRRENDIIFIEVLSQGIVSQTLKNHVDEKYEEVVNENLDLRKTLEEFKHEIKTVQSVRDKLNLDLVNGSNLLLKKEKELMILANDKKELSDIVANMQRENDIVYNEVLSQVIVSQTLKNSFDEKHEELSLVEKKLGELVKENLDLKNTLEKSEHEFRTVQSVRDKLNLDLVNGNNLLQSKEKELKILENDKKELSEIVADLRRENDIVLIDVLSQDILSQTLKNYIDEKHEELSLIEKKLEKSEHEFRTVQSVRDKLNLDLVNGNNLLQLNEKELKILSTDNKELSEIVADLRRERDILFNEVLSQGIVSQTLKNHVDEKNEELSLVEKKLEEVGNGNLDLRKTLEESEHEIQMLQSVRDKLNLDLMNENNLLQSKEKELKIIANDKKEMSEIVADLRRENDVLFNEVLTQGILSQTLKNYIDEKHDELSLVEKKLEKSEHEFRTVQSVHDKLNLDLANGNSLLQLKEKELEILDNDKKELSEIVADLRRENKEVIMTNDQQGKQILKLVEDNDHLSKESRILEVKMQQLTEKLEKTEEKTQMLETEASLIYGDLQTSIICQALLEQKISELTDVCLSLQDENNSKDLNTELLKERSNILEYENVDLKGRLDAYGPALESLRESIISLENHTCVETKVPLSENENEKAGESATMERDAFVELQDLQSKVKVIEMAVAEMQTLSDQQKLDSDAKLKSAMMQIEELSQPKNYRMPKSTSEISEADPKDIMLDQASECSSYGVSKRGLIEGEIWETTDDSKTMFKHHPTASDMSLDNILEVSRRFKEPHEDGNKRKVLERLNSDVQRLTNLQITIDDLKRKVNTTLKTRSGKAVTECETLKGQLTEAESAIEKLYELNARLVKHIEGNPEKSSTSESGETESLRRKKVSEQAKRVSENIGRMQIQIQKIQFQLLKLDDESEPTGKERFLDTKKRVVLKDYLYGGGRTKTAIIANNRRKKGHFCGCVEPSTKGD